MKHVWIIAILLAVIATFLGAGVVLADGGPHGGYTSTTDACAGCHRAHTALGDNLLKSATTYELCNTCHGVTAGGASTDVKDGRWLGTGGGSLKGGGFVNASMNTALTGIVTTTVSSKHAVVGMTGYSTDTIWGIGAINSGAGTSFALECSTCHNPHGKSGASNEATYRILRASPKGVSGLSGTPLTVADVTTKTYTISDTTGKYYGQKYPALTDTGTDNDKIATLSNWCARCHTRIHATSFADSGDAIFKYRHRTDGSNVSNSDANGAPACLTCHVAHGTIASMGTNSAAVPKPGTAEGGGNYLDSALLRIDNRGVCQACHNK